MKQRNQRRAGPNTLFNAIILVEKLFDSHFSVSVAPVVHNSKGAAPQGLLIQVQIVPVDGIAAPGDVILDPFPPHNDDHDQQKQNDKSDRNDHRWFGWEGEK